MNIHLPFLKLSLVYIMSVFSVSVFKPQETVTLSVKIETTKYNNGQIAFALFDNADAFLKTPLKSDTKKVEGNTVTFEFKDISIGTYSFSYFHDLNSNDELDTNFMGVPKEPYGFSNNQKGRFGPPDFEDAKIRIDKDSFLKLTIK